MRRVACLLLAIALAACAETVWTVPVVPVPPQPAPVVDPVDPGPVTPPTQVATYEAVASIQAGWTLDQVRAHLGFQAVLSALQDDGTTIARWPAVNQDGLPRWADVVFNPTGKLVGFALLPRGE